MKPLALLILIIAMSGIPILSGGAEGEMEIAKEEISKTIPSEGISLLLLRNVVGKVEVQTWEKREVLVKATKQVKAQSKEKAKEYLERLKLRIGRKKDKIEIVAEEPKPKPKGADFSVDYYLSLPVFFKLDISTIVGDIDTE